MVEGLFKTNSSGGKGIKTINITYFQANQPNNANDGELWYDTTNKLIKTYKNGAWDIGTSPEVGAFYLYNSTYYYWDGNSMETVDTEALKNYNNLVNKPQINGEILSENKSTTDLKLNALNVDYVVNNTADLPTVSGPGATALVIDISTNAGTFYKSDVSTNYNWVVDSNKKHIVGRFLFNEEKQELYLCYKRNDIYAPDSFYYYLKITDSKKQNKLTAGNNITIDENDVISASSGATPLSALQVQVSYNNDVIKGVAVVVDSTTINTKNNGLAIFTGLSSGNKTITASKDGYLTATETKQVTNPVETKDIEMQPLTVTFTVTDSSNNPLSGATVTLGDKTATTNNNGQAVFSGVLDGSYSYSIALTSYDTETGTMIVARQAQTQTIIMLAAPISCYAVEAVELDDDVKLNEGVGDSDTDYNVYGENTEITNELTLEGLARSSASAGEKAQIRVTNYNESNIQINTIDENDEEIDVDDIEFNNKKEIKSVNINIDAKTKYLCFTNGTDTIYFKESCPFIPRLNNDGTPFEWTSFPFKYYTYANEQMTEHSDTTNTASANTYIYNQTTQRFELSIITNYINYTGLYRDSQNDIVVDGEEPTFNSVGYLTPINANLGNANFYRLEMRKLNSDWNIELMIGNSKAKFVDKQIFYVKANQQITMILSKSGSNLLKDRFIKTFYISSDNYTYRKQTIKVTSNQLSKITITVNGIDFVSENVYNKTLELYQGEAYSYKVEYDGQTQTGTGTAATGTSTENIQQKDVTF